VETWWHRAVFYRLDPATFQDSNGDGRGDLAGVAQRLELPAVARRGRDHPRARNHIAAALAE
jgi:hypothetical protein